MLGLIEDQDGATPLLIAAQQMVGHGQAHLLFASALVGQRQVVEDRLQKAGAVADVAVGQEDGIQLGAEPLEQAMTQQRLAGARIAR